MTVVRLLVDDVGLELEFPNLTETTLSKMVTMTDAAVGWKVDHDGSVQREAETYSISPYYKLPFKSEGFLRRSLASVETCGAELVSPIIRTEDNLWIDNVKQMLDIFGNQTFGFLDTKCAFHVHVNMTGAPLYVLKNIIKIWLGIESFVFRISVAELGYHRGIVRRNFLYCRPILSPQVVLDREGYLRPSCDYQALLAAKTIREFFLALNNTSIHKDPSKYNPVRYGALNFFNFVKFGTVEFRSFNLSYNWKYVVAWVNLSKAICRAAFGKEYEYPQMTLGTNCDNFDLETLRAMLNLDDWTMLVLYELFYMNDWVPFEHPSWQFTHLSDNKITNWSNVPKILQPPNIEGQRVKYYPDKHTEQFAIITSGSEILGDIKLNLVKENRDHAKIYYNFYMDNFGDRIIGGNNV